MSRDAQLSLAVDDDAEIELADPRTSGSLPEGWCWARLPDLIASRGVLTDGDWVESKDQDPTGDVRLTQLADVGDGDFRDRSDRYLTAAKADELRCTLLEPGDVLVARMPDPLGRCCLFPGSPMPCVTVVDVCVVRPGTEAISPRWLKSFINTPTHPVRVASLQSGSTRKRISKKNLGTIPLPVPPTAEQHRIADAVDSYLSRLDDVVATLARVQRNLKRYRASVLKAAVEGRLVPTEAELAREEGRDYEPADVLLRRILEERKLRWIEEAAEQARAKAEQKAKAAGKRWTKADDQAALDKGRKAAAKKYEEPEPPDTSELPQLPEGWCWTTIDQLRVDSLIGLVRGRHEQSSHGPGHSYLKMDSIGMDGNLDLSCLTFVSASDDEADRYRVLEGDVLFNTRNSVELVGKTCWVGTVHGTILFNNNIMRLRFASSSSSRFVAFQMCSPSFRARMDLVKKATTSVAAVYARDLLPLPLALPPSMEQERIATELSRLLSVADAVEALVTIQVLRAERSRQAILKWAFEGRLVDQDRNDEPASVLLERIKAEREKASATNGKKKRGRGARKKATE